MSRGPERRADPRAPVSGAFLRLLSRDSAHILDVSAGGMLLETNAVALPGTRAQLATRLNGWPFNVVVKVTHLRPPQTLADGSKARIGVEFGALDEDSRKALARFLGTAEDSQA